MTYWQKDVCGSRYGKKDYDGFVDLEVMARERYRLEPYIPDFADFKTAKDKQVLEIGVGGGADFCCWVKAGARATGIDLTEAAIKLTKRRLTELGLPQDACRLTTGR